MIRRIQTAASLATTILLSPALLLHEATHAVAAYPVAQVPAAGVLTDTSKPYFNTAGAWVWTNYDGGGFYGYVITLSPLMWLVLALYLATDAVYWSIPMKIWLVYVGAAGAAGLGDLLSILNLNMYNEFISDCDHITLIGQLPE